MRPLLPIVVFGIASLSLFSQSMRFEVVSIKPHSPDDGPVIGTCHAVDSPQGAVVQAGLGRCSLKRVTVSRLINSAYDLQLSGADLNQMIAGPSWIFGEEYDVEAKAESPQT